MSKENQSQEWERLWMEYNKSLKSWTEAFESLQRASIEVQTKYNKAMVKALKDSNNKSMSQFIENWQKSVAGEGIAAFKQSGGTDNPVAVQKVAKKSSSGQAINDLMTLGNSFGANTSLLKDVSKVLNDSDPSNDKTVCGKLGMFINQVNQNHRLNPEQKAQLIATANEIKTSIGCKKS